MVINGGLLVVIVGARLALGIPLLSIGLGLAGRVARLSVRAYLVHGDNRLLSVASDWLVLKDLPQVVNSDTLNISPVHIASDSLL